MACTACLVCLISTVNGCSKKELKKAKNVALAAGTKQTLSNLFFHSIFMDTLLIGMASLPCFG
jgi:hypothetical protein